MKSFRNLEYVLNKIIKVIPDVEDNKNLIQELNNIIKDIIYKAPELHIYYWIMTQNILQKYIPIIDNNKPWQNEILIIFNEKLS